VSDKLEMGKKELLTLKVMIRNWVKSYKRDYDGTDWSFSADDLQEEIMQQVYPYVDRMYTTGYIDNVMVSEFSNWCTEQVERLREDLKPNHWFSINGVASW